MAVKRYLNTVRSKFGYLATWLPNTALKLGDVGLYTDQGFRRETTLQRLGLSVKVRRSKLAGDLNHAAVDQVQASVGLKGVGAIKLGFGQAGGCVFHASGCTVEELEEVDTLSIELLDLFRQGIWKRAWVLVDTIVKAEKATIFVSENDNATLEISGPTDLTQLGKVELAVTAQSGSILRFEGQAGLTPLFRGRRVGRKYFGLFGSEVEVMRGIETPEEAAFDALDPLDFMEETP